MSETEQQKPLETVVLKNTIMLKRKDGSHRHFKPGTYYIVEGPRDYYAPNEVSRADVDDEHFLLNSDRAPKQKPRPGTFEYARAHGEARRRRQLAEALLAEAELDNPEHEPPGEGDKEPADEAAQAEEPTDESSTRSRRSRR